MIKPNEQSKIDKEKEKLKVAKAKFAAKKIAMKERAKRRAEEKKKSPTEHYYTRLFRECRTTWSQTSPVRKECLRVATEFDRAGMKKYKCASCKSLFAYSEIDVDHIQAIGTTKPKDYYEFMKAFEALDSVNLQILCKGKCHKKKTNEDIKKMRNKTI